MTSDSFRDLVVCADDYGLSMGNDAGIRELALAGRLSAVAAMPVMPSWPESAPALAGLCARLNGDLQAGLHLTLTDFAPLGPMPHLAPQGCLPDFPRLWRLAVRRRLPIAEIAAEVTRQLDAFVAHFGALPDFVSGYRHVHVLPGVRDVVLGLFASRLDPQRVWLRDCCDCPWRLLRRPAPLTAGGMAMLGWRLRRKARALGLRTNSGFSGFYHPDEGGFARAMPGMLAAARSGHLLMVHPGHVDAALCAVDPWAERREREWAFLMGERFSSFLAASGWRIRTKQ